MVAVAETETLAGAGTRPAVPSVVALAVAALMGAVEEETAA